jgi:transposase
MSNGRYTDEFKTEAVGQILERGYSVKEVSERIGVSTHSLYNWIKADPRNPESFKAVRKNDDLAAENARLKAELKRVQEERDILKKAAAYFASQSE